MNILIITFWACLALVFYTYLGYGMLLFCIVKLKELFSQRRQATKTLLDSDLPALTLLICAYNEEGCVDEKMENIRSLSYPKEKLTVMWVTDGSTDNTNNLLANYPEVKVVFTPERRGKTHAMYHGLEQTDTPIVVFTDANTMLNANALRVIAHEMQRPEVGCVAGEKRVASLSDKQQAAHGEGLYWRYESKLKQLDSRLYSAMGAAGELYAVKVDCFEKAPANALLDDFMVSMMMLRKKRVTTYTSEAYALEHGSADIHEEQKRKRRIAAGGLQSIYWLRDLLNPISHPVVSFQFLSHRVLRWSITPIALFMLVPINVAIVLAGAPCFYTIVWILQLLFYFAALAGWWQSEHNKKSRLLYIPFYFVFMNVCVLQGFAYLRSHSHSGTWEKSRRA